MSHVKCERVTLENADRLSQDMGWKDYQTLKEDLGGSITGQYVYVDEFDGDWRVIHRWPVKEIQLVKIIHGRLFFEPPTIIAIVSPDGQYAIVESNVFELATS